MTSGYHAFANNELLTAQKVNTYLMRQAVVGVDSAAERNAIPTPDDGMVVYRRDLDALEIRSNGAWLTYDTRPTTYTPTNLNFVIGNGTSKCWYLREGEFCNFQILLIRGSTTSGSGVQEFGLPFAAHADYYSTNQRIEIAWGQFADAGVNRYTLKGVLSQGMGANLVAAEITPSQLTNTSPVTQNAGDQVSLVGRYRMA